MPINNRKPSKSEKWRELPIEEWNVTTYTSYLTDRTRELYDVDYAPGGGGSKSQRWGREKGMMKQAQGKYGNKVLREFITICLREYSPSGTYLHPTFTFMYSFMDRYFAQAQAEVARGDKREETQEDELSAEEIRDLL